MHSRIKRMRHLILIVVIFCAIQTSVRCETRTAETCIQCDSANEDQKDCGFVKDSENLTVCSSTLGCFTELYLKTDNAYPGWYTRRGCTEASATCNTCIFCDENNCNGEVIPADRNKCLKCNNGDCSQPKSEYCQIHLSDKKDCVTLFDEDGSVLLKSCYADIPDATRELCDDSNYLDCKKCTGENCNVATTREGTKCHQCIGSDCLLIDTPATLVDCRSDCYIGMNSNGEPVRGCANNFNNTNHCSRNELSTSECFVCSGDSCNAIVYPQTGRLQCHTCSDGDCEPNDENLEICSRYGNDERCASVFDETRDEVIARGCVSSLESQLKTSCESNSTNCLKCAYDKCNKDDSKLKTEFCIGCSSESDLNCLKANSTFEKRCSSNLCFARLVEADDKHFGRSMERGCLADLLTGTTCIGPDCISCQGRNCNNQLFPQNRISCKSCQFETCNNGGIVDKICNQYVSEEACLTLFGEENEVIYRECYADAPSGTREVCDDENDLQCTKCSGTLCNTDTIRKGNRCFKCEGVSCVNPGLDFQVDCMSECYVGMNSAGEPVRGCSADFVNSTTCGLADLTCLRCNDDYCNGITYPTEGRLTCNKCLNDDCTTFNVISEYCERLHSNESCATVFDDSGLVNERGCLTTLQYSSKCDAGNPNCLRCGYDECNVEDSVNQKFHCVSCHSEDDPNCVSNPNKTATAGCTTNQCYSRLSTATPIGWHIERGCTSDLQQCSGSSCQTCTGERCNSQTYPSDRHTCYQCSGDQCAMGLLNEKKCTIYNQPDKNCVSVFGTENEVIYRDCFVDTVEGTRLVCNDNEDLLCTKCEGKNCNSQTLRRGVKCLKCDGLECFYAEDISNSIDCVTGGCYIGLNAKGEIKRDCAMNVAGSSNCPKNETQTGTCLTCQDDYCNAIVFPTENRLICKECLGESCEESTLEEKYCERLHSNETCVSVFDNSDKIRERGCSSTIQNAAICNASDPNCVKCNFNSCNDQNSKQDMYHCEFCDSRIDPKCATNSSVSTKSCTTNECYSRLLPVSNGSIWQYVEKGCLADIPSVNCSGASCTSCGGDRCNNVIYPADRISCLTCRNEECKSASIPSKLCDLYNSSKKSCVTLYDSSSEVSYRGCYSDAAEGTRDVCDDNTQLLCSTCTSNNCNVDTQRRGKKCFKCHGVDCFKPDYPADVVDCLSNCYMGVDSTGNSIRGCSSNFTNTTLCGADDGVNRCHVCNDDMCNGVQFPLTNRLQCHVCTEESCKAADDNLEFCDRYGSSERCVTVFSNDNKVQERGCMSSLMNSRYCQENASSCLKCPSSGCNTVTSKENRLCAVCNSMTDSNCVLNPTLVASKYCNLGCYTRLVNGTLDRGCYDDLAECSSSNQCEFCNVVDKCNVETYPKDRKSCETCAGTTNCASPIPRLCLNYGANETCVTVFTGYHVSRKGCLLDQPTSSQAICASSVNPLCASCRSSDNCNNETVRRDENCIICNSALDRDCAQRPGILVAQHCPVASDGQCFSRIQNGTTIRGCRGQLSSSVAVNCSSNTATSPCSITSGSQSNHEIIPSTRLNCYHCDSRVDASCADGLKNSSLLPCIMFHQPEKCLKLVREDDSIVRGCVSDFSADICQLGGTCTTCSEKGCNDASTRNISIFCLTLSLIMLLSSLLK